jgi:hypothetical protein
MTQLVENKGRRTSLTGTVSGGTQPSPFVPLFFAFPVPPRRSAERLAGRRLGFSVRSRPQSVPRNTPGHDLRYNCLPGSKHRTSVRIGARPGFI